MPEPVLPAELEREIFEIAALSNSRSIPRLLLVSRRVRIWIEPLLYRIVVFRSPLSTLVRFPSNVFDPETRTKSPAFFQQHVHHLCVGNMDVVSHKALEAILSTCSGVYDLLISIYDPPPNTLALIATMPLQRLCADLHFLFATDTIDFAHPVFANITHLDLLDPDMGDWGGLALLPSLTHLAFNDDAPTDVLRTVLADCAALRVLTLLCDTRATELSALASDVRLVVVLCTSSQWFREDWQRGARGGRDYWRTAEEFIERRRAGTVDPLRFWVNHVWDADN
ncbi:hypothetical protein C8R44DRAFT_761485 [Mycena epipterygia]|nr:hypothetical protein C8R44DRAFT_761485 [Mycena epipterygia]